MTLTDRPTTPAPRRPGVRAILTPGWLGIIAVALVFAGACWFVLAPWQYGRHVERTARNDQIERAVSAAPVPVTDLLAAGTEPADDILFRLVTATGRYIPEGQAFVRLRQQNGTGASEVVVPFELADGTRILVDRGYVSTDELAAGALPADLPSGRITVTGRVSADQPDPSQRTAQRVDGRLEVYGIDSATLLGSAPGARLGFVQLVGTAPGALDEIGVPDRDAGPFLSYALQWLVFGAVALLAAGVFAYREITEPAAGEKRGPDASPSPETRSPNTLPPGDPPRRARFDKSQLYD